MSRWYTLEPVRESLEWELFRALARPSNPEAAKALLDNLCNICGHPLGWVDWAVSGRAAGCFNIHCHAGVHNGRALLDGVFPNVEFLPSREGVILQAPPPEPPPLRWIEAWDWPVHSVIRDLKDTDLMGGE